LYLIKYDGKKKHPELFPQATHAPGKQKPPCYLGEGMVAEQSFYPLSIRMTLSLL
jgi:hypothetical protein